MASTDSINPSNLPSRAPSNASQQYSSPRQRRSLSGSIRRFSDLSTTFSRRQSSAAQRPSVPVRSDLLLLRPPRGWRSGRSDDLAHPAQLKSVLQPLPPCSSTSSYSPATSTVSDVAPPAASPTQTSLPKAVRTGWVIVHGTILRKRMFLVLTTDGVLAVCAKQPVSPPEALRDATWVLPVKATSIKTFPPPSARINITLSKGDLDNMPLSLRLHFANYQETAEWKFLLNRAANSRSLALEPTLESRYILEDTISDGAFSSVQIAIKRGTDKRLALRIIHPPAITEQSDRPESDRIELVVLPKIRHPAILPVFDIFRTPEKQVIAVVELMSNRFTLDIVLEREHFLPEPRVKEIARNVLSALAHLHQMGLVHRAVNTRHIFCVPTEENHQALRVAPRQTKKRSLTGRRLRDTPPHHILADVSSPTQPGRRTSIEQAARPGVAACLSEISLVNYSCEPIAGRAFLRGIKERPHFAAPEAIRSLSYGSSIDIWGLGVTVFFALSGLYPFGRAGGSYMEVLREIDTFQKLTFHGGIRHWRSISPDARDFIRQALTRDVTKRPCAVDLLAHPWFNI